MHPVIALVGIVVAGTPTSAMTTTKLCPLLGPAFPAPTALSSNTHFQDTVGSLNDALTSMMETGTSAYGTNLFNATTMSIGMFSTSEENLIYDFHYTGPDVSVGTVGVNQADSRSIYRIGSVSKLLTVFLLLVQSGLGIFNDPISKYIPELTEHASQSQDESTVRWDEITIGHLVSHMAGIPREYGISELGYSWESIPGLPSLPTGEVATCNYIQPDGSFKACTAQEILDGVAAESALFHTSSSPVYSNDAFSLVGIALENITGCTLEDLFMKRIVQALDLNHTSYTVPNNTTDGVIPVNTTVSMWNSDVGAIAPSGGYFSSTSDLATFGRAILNSSLLPPAATRQWMKPVTFTPSVNVAVGAPWEIFRVKTGGQIVDLYTKNGDVGAYSSLFVLIPEFEVGFSILTASQLDDTSKTTIVYLVSEMITATMLPALQEAAKQQANEKFAGHYVFQDGSSSVDITVDDQPALRVTNWVYNGTRFFEEILGVSNTNESYVDFRIQPNQLYSGNQVGFTGVWETMPKTLFSGPLDLNCMSWGGADGATYAKIGLEKFVFETDPVTGIAVAVIPKALRVSLEKE